MTIKDLHPSAIWKYFDEVTQIPRPSKKEEKIISYLMNFGQALGLETKKDQLGNIIITKPATPGFEKLPTIVLQSHMDMVAEKNQGVNHDFENDPIETVIEGDWIKANGTTLGADNGIGMAAELAILASDNIQHGKIECLFTVDEETGLNGAVGIEPDFFTGKILLNLDSEDEGEIFIGCAGGMDTVATFNYQPESSPENYFFFKINITGLKGGHSGGDIHLGRANANKLLTRFIWEINKKYDLRISRIDGGNLRNAIPREAACIAAVPFTEKENIRIDFNIFLQEVEEEFGKIEPERIITLESADCEPMVIDKKTGIKLLNALYACPHGVMAMSKEIPGLVETSTNLANIKMQKDNKIVIGTSQRSSLESAKKDILQMVESVFMLAEANTITHGEGYPGWKPNPDSNIVKIAAVSYQKLFGINPKITAIHAGLECGLFLNKYPELEMISFGPTLRDVHSPDEKMYIPSVDKFWRFLLEILKSLPANN
ncbi:MAG: aminoacyl-histidine dipeptidase [Candidatus Azobacteroides sp.]|nr:aminoacyl-histidine dipeptidase [Candidatus Azobacteroides sp.]